MKKFVFICLLLVGTIMCGFANETAASPTMTNNLFKYYPFGENLNRSNIRFSDYDDGWYDGGYSDNRKYKKSLHAAIAMTAVGGGLTVLGAIPFTFGFFTYLEFIIMGAVIWVFALPAWIIMIPMWARAAYYHNRLGTAGYSDGDRMSCAIRIKL